MARSGTVPSRPANLNRESAGPDSDGSLSREQKLEPYYFMRLTGPLEDYVLPRTSDIVVALRKLASY